MLSHSVRFAALLAIVAVMTGCDRALPSAPTRTIPQSLPPAPAPAPFPVEGARVFVYASARGAVMPYTLASRFVLHDNGTFALQYLSGSQGSNEYRGTYTEVDGLVTFHWEGWSTAGSWGATGVLTGDSLAVTFNMIMLLSDFENATYTLASGK